jgi:hypothetical protein
VSGEEKRVLDQALANSLQEVRRVEHVIPDAPVKYPTHAQFEDAIGYIMSIRDECAEFGMCVIVPPEGWDPRFALDVAGKKTFSTRTQDVHTLQERTTDGFDDGGEYTYAEYRAAADAFEKRWLIDNYGSDAKVPIEILEKDYWEMVETGRPSATVQYGNDVEASTFGSGFVEGYSKGGDMVSAQQLWERSEASAAYRARDMRSPDYYKCSPWNLQNVALQQESLLKYQSEPINGVNSPWMYFGMLFTSFCWHTEDNYLYSINYSHHGSQKQWYSIPGYAAKDFEKAVQASHLLSFKDDPNFLYDITTQFSPSYLKARGVPVYRAVQGPRSFVVTFPRAYHGGFNYGFNCNEAVNFGTYDWLEFGRQSIEKYRTANRGSPFSIMRLLFTLCKNFTDSKRAEEKIMLLEVMQPVIEDEIIVRDYLMQKEHIVELAVDNKKNVPKKADYSMMRKEGMDYDERRTCFHCKYVCTMSAIACDCDKIKVSCSRHFKLMCNCPNSKKKILG